MTIEEFNRQLSVLLAEVFHGLPLGKVPIRLTFQLYDPHPDPNTSVRVDLSIRQVWET